MAIYSHFLRHTAGRPAAAEMSWFVLLRHCDVRKHDITVSCGGVCGRGQHCTHNNNRFPFPEKKRAYYFVVVSTILFPLIRREVMLGPTNPCQWVLRQAETKCSQPVWVMALGPAWIRHTWWSATLIRVLYDLAWHLLSLRLKCPLAVIRSINGLDGCHSA